MKFEYLILFIFVMSFSSCDKNHKHIDYPHDSAQETPSFPLKISKKYDKHPLTGDSLKPVLNSKGDTIKTGIPIPMKGKEILSDSILSPVVHPINFSQLKSKPYIEQTQVAKVKHPKEPLRTTTVSNMNDSIRESAQNPNIFFPSGVQLPLEFEEIEYSEKPLISSATPLYRDYASYNILHYGEIQGLINENMNSLFTDSKGNLWICSYGHGIIRYDGEYFKQFLFDDNFLNNQVKCGLEDEEGNLWFGSYNLGIYKYDGESFTKLVLEKDKPYFNIMSMTQDKSGAIWYAIDRLGLLKMSNDSFELFTEHEGLASNELLTVSLDNEENIWLGTRDGYISKFDGIQFENYQFNSETPIRNIQASAVKKNGTTWFGTSSGAIKHDGKNFWHYGLGSGLGDNTVQCVSLDSEDNPWFGTRENGMFKLEKDKFIQISEKHGLSSNDITGILSENPKIMWIATVGGGLSKLDFSGFRHIRSEHGFDGEQVSSILEARNGTIWLATYNNGLFMFDGKTFINFKEEDGLCLNKLGCLLEDSEGNIWIGSLGNGVSKFDGISFTNYTASSGLSGDFIWAIIEDKNQNIWLSSFDGGMTRYNGSGFTHYTENEGLCSNGVWSIEEDAEGNIWIGSHEQGISKFDGEFITHFSHFEGFTGKLVWDIFLDSKNNLWFSTYASGAIKFDGNTFKNYLLDIDSKIKSVQEDEEHNIWISTDSGVKFLNKNSETDEFSIVPITYLDGIRNNSSYLASSMIDKHHNYWVATPKALYYLDINEFRLDHLLPKVNLRQLDVNSIINWNDNKLISKEKTQFEGVHPFENYPKNLQLSCDHNNLKFYYSVSDIYYQQRTDYSFLLEGYDTHWSEPSDQTEIEYKNLPSGEYSLNIKARRKNGSWGESFVYPFTIHPPWYKSNLAYFGYLISVFLFYMGIIKWRTSNLRKRQSELLTQVKFATRKLSAQKENVERQKKVIETAHQEITDSIKYAKRIQRAILPQLSEVKNKFPESFVLYEPKDVVAGDFYWMETTEEESFIAVADCTGHGVPGAMVSVVCNNGLNRSVREHNLKKPGNILDKTRQLVSEEFEKSEDDVKDGMDIALCAFHGNKLSYSGANIPLWIISDGQFIETKPSKQPIGKLENHQEYPTFEIELKAGDTVYMFSDGFVDQFGGEKNKKFKRFRLRNLLQSIQHEEMVEQGEILKEVFETWKGENEQVDDVCVIGIRIPSQQYMA